MNFVSVNYKSVFIGASPKSYVIKRGIRVFFGILFLPRRIFFNRNVSVQIYI